MTGSQARRRVVASAVDVVEVVEEPLLRLEAGEALVKLSVSGVCGSDKAGVHGEHVFMGPPYYPGHEVVGVVEAVGEGASVVRAVTVEPTLPCGRCKPCLHKAENLRENLQFFGCGYREDGIADVFTEPAQRLYRFPQELTDHEAALIELLATAVHAVRLAGHLKAKAVAVLGSGTIGLLTLLVARQAAARRVVSTDMLATNESSRPSSVQRPWWTPAHPS